MLNLLYFDKGKPCDIRKRRLPAPPGMGAPPSTSSSRGSWEQRQLPNPGAPGAPRGRSGLNSLIPVLVLPSPGGTLLWGGLPLGEPGQQARTIHLGPCLERGELVCTSGWFVFKDTAAGRELA